MLNLIELLLGLAALALQFASCRRDSYQLLNGAVICLWLSFILHSVASLNG